MLFRIDDNQIVLNLHGTTVATFYASGNIAVRHGGRGTATTKDRINRALAGSGCVVFQKQYDWYVRRADGKTVPFGAGFDTQPVKVFDQVQFLIDAESGPIDQAYLIEGVQSLIDTRVIYSLQGSWQRTAQNLVDAGLCHA